MPEEKGDNFFTELLKFALVAVVIVFPIRLFVAQPFIVSGASMEPTFDNGEYLIVDELSYRLQEPKRGDVVIFRYPKDPSQYFIKRIVGLPLEKVRISGENVFVVTPEGETFTLEEPYVTNEGNGRAMQVELEAEEYFVMGDNRRESSDSRIWGALPRENIVGRALLRLLPLDEAEIFPGRIITQ